MNILEPDIYGLHHVMLRRCILRDAAAQIWCPLPQDCPDHEGCQIYIFCPAPTSRSPSCRTPLQLLNARVFILAARVRLCCYCYSNLIIILLLSTATRTVV